MQQLVQQFGKVKYSNENKYSINLARKQMEIHTTFVLRDIAIHI